MDSKRLIIFIVLSLGILLLWQEFFAPKPLPQQPVQQNQVAAPAPSGQPAHDKLP